MGTLVTLAIILAVCAGLGALAGLAWAFIKGVPILTGAIRQGWSEGGERAEQIRQRERERQAQG
jgi:hypothetical protein